MSEIWSVIAGVFGDWNLRIMPVYLASTVLIAFGVFVWQQRSASVPGFLRWFVPADIYLHPSHIIDLKLFVVGRVFALIGIFNFVIISTLGAVAMIGVLSVAFRTEITSGEWSLPVMLMFTALFTVATDFANYWQHRIQHEHPALWPFHAVHHSAEVMTPVTVYRQHPVSDLIAGLFHSFALGLMSGVAIFAVSDSISVADIGGANLMVVFFNVIGNNLRHSHVWISYGPVIEHVFSSPAQHQIHHSRAPEHLNKNYGEIFSLWDWMFGTLYIPAGREQLVFGLADSDGRPIAQPHDSLRKALADPLRESFDVMRARFKPQADPGIRPESQS